MLAKLIVIIYIAVCFCVNVFFVNKIEMEFVDFWLKSGLLWFIIIIVSIGANSYQITKQIDKSKLRVLISLLLFLISSFIVSVLLLSDENLLIPDYATVLLSMLLGAVAQFCVLIYSVRDDF